MSVRALPLLRELLRELDTYWFYDYVTCFDNESPLLAAVSLEDDEMLQILLEQELPSKTEHQDPVELWAGIAIGAATAQGSVARVLAIFDGVTAAGFPVDGFGGLKAFYTLVLKSAIGGAVIDLGIVRGIS